MTTINDINELSKGAPINQLTVTVKKAFEPGEGEGQHGPWRMQAAILQDESGEIRATFWDRWNTDLRNFEGEEVTIVSGRDAKDKFAGITTDEYKGKRQLNVSKHATFASQDGEAPPDETNVVNEHPTGSPEPITSRRFVSEETKRASIEKQVALKAAVEFVVGAGFNEKGVVVKYADEFYQFLHGEPEVI